MSLQHSRQNYFLEYIQPQPRFDRREGVKYSEREVRSKRVDISNLHGQSSP